MKVLFHGDTLNYRGTTVALTDYARYNQEILGNESIIVFNTKHGYKKDMGTEIAVISELEKEFKVIGYEDGKIDRVIEGEKVDVSYFIRAGNQDFLPTVSKSAVHAVFQFNEPHGTRYAYISKWLSEHVTNGVVPYVPHIVNLPEPTGNYREVLGITDKQTVIGRIGGYYTFDIIPIKDMIIKLVNHNERFVFLFVGTEPFINHPNVRFIDEIHSPQKKANFINTCDCMLHARSRGETFGLSIAEFLSLGKPVFAWNGGMDQNHIDMLKNTNTLYNSDTDLMYKLHHVEDFKYDWRGIVKDYKPDIVMKKFNEVFLK